MRFHQKRPNTKEKKGYLCYVIEVGLLKPLHQIKVGVVI